jgi:ABC-type sulfate transport system substrate-binding protein
MDSPDSGITREKLKWVLIVQGVLGLLLGVTMILVPGVGVRAQNLTLLNVSYDPKRERLRPGRPW